MKLLRLIILYLFALLLTQANVIAQTQQGYVKTIGRPNKPGVGLQNVLFHVSGNTNTFMSNEKGYFSFPLQGMSFQFRRISLKGYELADRDFLRLPFDYTPSAPVTVAMISKEELAREREAIEESTRNKLSARFQNENAVLERKLERMQISNDEYKKRLLALHDKYDNIDTLVSVLSDRYARTDYDNIDSLRLLINQHIENGDLERAQQLILSKGSLNERAKELEETRKLRLQTQIREKILQKDFADDLYQLYEIAKIEHKYDSAYIYLEKRYFSDTTQVEYLIDLAKAARFIRLFPFDQKSQREERHLTYLLKLYGIIQDQDVSSMLGKDPLMAKAMMENKIGNYYRLMENDERAIAFYYTELQTRIDGKIGYEYQPLESIGSIYQIQKDYQKAISVYRKALDYCKDNDDSKESIHRKIANTYYFMGEVDNMIKEYIKLEKIYSITQETDTSKIKDLYILQGFIAKSMSEKGNKKEAIRYYEKAAKNAEHYYNLTNETKYIKPIIVLLKERQDLHAERSEYKQMYVCAEKAMNYARIILERQPSAYSRLLYAEVLCQMADAHANMSRISSVEKELVECLKNSEFASNIFHTRYKQLTYNIYNTFATIYYKKRIYDRALKAINKSISIMPEMLPAYMKKRKILNAIGDKNEIRELEDNLFRLKEKNDMKYTETLDFHKDPMFEDFNLVLSIAGETIVFSSNPFRQYEYELLNK